MLALAAALAAAAVSQPPVRQYNPTFNASALTSHDPWSAAAGSHSHTTGWPTNPDNMPIGNGRLTALVWGDGTHANTSGVAMLLARDDAWTGLSQLIKLGRLRVQLDPDPFRNASECVLRKHIRHKIRQFSAAFGSCGDRYDPAGQVQPNARPRNRSGAHLRDLTRRRPHRHAACGARRTILYILEDLQ